MSITYDIQQTWLHKTNPSVKLILFLLLFIFVLFVHNPNIMMNLTFFFLVLLLLFSGHPKKYVFLYSLPFLFIFISSSTAMMFFGKGETTWFHWGLVHITEESFYRGLHIGFRALYFATLGLLFALTTRPVLLFYSLMQQLKLPPKFAYSFMAAIRLIPIMLDEFQTLRHALKVRGVSKLKGFRGFYQKLKFFSIPLLAQSIRRAQRIAIAMEAKRFTDLKKRTYFYVTTFSKHDLLFMLCLLLGIGAMYLLGMEMPYFQIVDVRHYD